MYLYGFYCQLYTISHQGACSKKMSELDCKKNFDKEYCHSFSENSGCIKIGSCAKYNDEVAPRLQQTKL